MASETNALNPGCYELDMGLDSTLDRDPLQLLLASAYAIQESGLDNSTLSTILEVQQSMAAAGFDADHILQLIADRALDVANAAGIAVGLLKAGKLVYRAGSGNAAAFVGRSVSAILVSSGGGSRREILCVKDAATDSRIEAAVCRQFGARALLILPIYREHILVGVINILFSEPHLFQEGEMRAYQLLADLVRDTMLKELQVTQNVVPAKQSPMPPPSSKWITSQMQVISREQKVEPLPSNRQVHKNRGAASSVRAELRGLWPALVGLAIAIGLLMICQSVQHDYRDLSSRTGSGITESRVTATPSVPPKAPRPAFRRVRVGRNEVDYLAEGVTIRLFTPEPKQAQVYGSVRQINIGDDVTVRYFADNSAVVPAKRILSPGHSVITH